MKLHTPDGQELMQIEQVRREGDTLVVRGVIMGTMPTRAVIDAENIRAAFRLLSLRLILDVIVLLFRRSPR